MVTNSSTFLKVTDVKYRSVVLTVAAKCTNMTGENYQGHAVSLAGEQVAPGEILIILHAILNVTLMSNSLLLEPYTNILLD